MPFENNARTRVRHLRKPTRRRQAIAPVAGLLVGGLLTFVIPAQIANSSASVIATDAFQRSVSSGWGSAATGGAWSLTADKATATSVASGAGAISGLARSRAVTATLKKVSVADVDVQATLGITSTSPRFYEGTEVRRQSDGSSYRGRLSVADGGKTDLLITRVNKSTETSLARVALPFTTQKGSKIRSEFRVTGSGTVSIAARAWVIGKSTPAWQLKTTDTSPSRIAAAGAVGFWEYASALTPSPVGTTFDDVIVARDPGSDAATPPVTPPTVPTAPTAPTPPTVPTAPSNKAGSVAVGSATYPAPANAIYVSPSGSDRGAGSVSAPLASLTAAVAKATTGSTIVLRGGTYNQSVVVPATKSNLTIQAYPREAVWLDGSIPVTNWSKTGSTWTSSGWSAFFDNTLDGIADNPLFVDPAHPLAARADQLFFDGIQLTQVADASKVVTGTFAVSQSSHTIVVGTDPTGRQVKASNLEQALYSTADGTTLQGFGVRNYATPYNTHGAIRLGGPGSTARNLVIQDDATTGIQVAGDAMTLDHLTVIDNGMQGVAANRSYGFALTNSVLSGNDSQQFNEAPVSGGLKITRSRGVNVSDNVVSGNKSFGLWFDESCYDVNVTGNTVTGNGGHGIEVEISAKTIIANNVATSNGKSGIRLLNTSEAQIFNNDIGGNGVFGIQLSQDQRREADPSVPGHDPRRPVPDPSFSWLTQNVTIANNAFGSGGNYQIYALDNHTGVPVDAWNLRITGNLFNSQVTPSQALIMAWGLGDKSSYIRFSTAASLSTSKGSSWKNAETLASLPLSGMTSAIAAVTGLAVPLPADVASVTGQKTGAKVIGTF